MGLLDEPAFERLLATGCTACGSNRLELLSYVDGRLPLLGGEPVGTVTWVYDGEKFVDGVFEVNCADCRHALFHAAACPRCHAGEGLVRARAATNRWPVPTSCRRCGAEEVRYLALMPAKVRYEGRRAERARSNVEMHDPGYHGYRVDCVDCGTVAEQVERCPLCNAEGPLRTRPG